ncbi:Phosphoenolpyruvate synthase [Sinomonas atrocyanea]|uniref:Phosphoenolpyruvate synthase n=1 Tax=Sinomonas atrocyanea TaxID=37927 RepID=A0A126ZY07_9MICC|nr:phosphoenolpyruvate synthase [Sinomonas atrocyanea]AMM31285.1 Phosphoenolpyruvate synthase [Sinomonas atrocyanea]GEB64505.1 phosphoenolpyruvate synthase [Sinomonas atrocyanea]GGG64490.1 phosphoenolpyruvate synthase [Sinomonas atrocyanea]
MSAPARPGTELVVAFDDVGIADVPRVGGKNASLGELTRHLASVGVAVPEGFATTADAYRLYLDAAGIRPTMASLLTAFRAGQPGLKATGAAIRELFLSATLPETLATAVGAAYRDLAGRVGQERPAVAVRSSATAEDLPEASFAGQQETFLNVSGEDELLDACRRCFASLFTDRAITYRELHGMDHLDVALSIGVQRMVRSDLAGSGVMFSLDTESGFPRMVEISAAWGLGETVVQGTVNPDSYEVFSPLVADPGLRPIIGRTAGAKEHKLVFAPGGSGTVLLETSEAERAAFVLDDSEVLTLARWATAVAEHYGRPMDMEWAKDGETGELFMVQARPETVQAKLGAGTLRVHRLDGTGPVLARGAAIGDAIAVGEACVIADPSQIAGFRDGSVLVTTMTDPDWVPIMKRASGIVTDHGGPTSHAAIVSRELGVPAVVGTVDGTSAIADGAPITVSCAQGAEGLVLGGRIPFTVEEADVGALPATRTHVMVNLADPSAAFRWWRLPVAGVGLARMEFIISNLIRVHPMALVHPEKVADAGEREEIAALTRGYRDPTEYFVDRLATGIAKIAAPFHPGPAIVRLSDFKTNEYANLLGGAAFEEAEENPMLGFRGASRYHDERYREGFALECRALKKAREELGFANVVVMVPFCRTPAEADAVLSAMAEHGLARGENGLKVYMMCEIPSNVVLAEKFAARFDGFSIGSNDLTQLVLGVDRDSARLAAQFDERDEAVTTMIAEAIRKAHAGGIPIGICGQGPSNHPDFAEFLVGEGIDSISLNPDSVLRTVPIIAAAEARHGGPGAGPGRQDAQPN